MGLCAAERKGNYPEINREPCWNAPRWPVYAALPLCEICGDSKGFDVKPSARIDGSGAWARAFAPLAVFALVGFYLAACGNLPEINGAPLPPEPADAHPVYRDLADIPEAPAVTPMEKNEDVIQALAQDRAKAAEAGQNLRRQPFDEPDPAMQLGF